MAAKKITKAAPKKSATPAKKAPAAKATAAKAPAKKAAAAKAPAKKAPAARRRPVEIDEPRQRAGDDREQAFNLETSDGTDALAEELGEEFVENVTGANDAAAEHREEMMDPLESMQPSTGGVEFADGTDASNPEDAEREALPTV